MDAAGNNYSYITARNIADNAIARMNAEYYEKKHFGNSVLENLRKDTLVKSEPNQNEKNIASGIINDNKKPSFINKCKNFVKRNIGNIIKTAALIATPIILIKGGKSLKKSTGSIGEAGLFKNIKNGIKKIFTKKA